ncbi:MAG: nucleoside recognition domain-containing protein, partial [Sediminibacterium sp.]
MKIPVVMALTMNDLAAKKDIKIDINGLAADLGIPVVAVNPRKNKGLNELKKVIAKSQPDASYKQRDFMDTATLAPAAVASVKQAFPEWSDYACIHHLINHEELLQDVSTHTILNNISSDHQFNTTKTQAEEIMQRYTRIRQIMQKNVLETGPLEKKLFTEKLDNILMHKTWGYLILFSVLFLLFQSIFWLATYPMDGIEWGFAALAGWLSDHLPEVWWSNLLINGFVAGLSGILVFVPQIMILFGLITILEDTGYMARISFLSDKLMRKVGLNGKSVMPMISSFACAVPAIMGARNIENKKERLLTIMITPLMSCSARLPVYTILIALVIEEKYYFGFLSLQGLVM